LREVQHWCQKWDIAFEKKPTTNFQFSASANEKNVTFNKSPEKKWTILQWLEFRVGEAVQFFTQ